MRERVSSNAEEGRDRALALQEQRHEEECATIKSHHDKELDDLRMQLVKENSSLAEQLENVENELRKEVGSVFKLSQEFLQSQRVRVSLYFFPPFIFYYGAVECEVVWGSICFRLWCGVM